MHPLPVFDDSVCQIKFYPFFLYKCKRKFSGDSAIGRERAGQREVMGSG